MTTSRVPRVAALTCSLALGLAVAACGKRDASTSVTVVSATPAATPTATQPAPAPLRPEQPVAYVVNPDGSGLREIFRSETAAYLEMAPSPDGSVVAVAAHDIGSGSTSVALVDVATGAARTLATTEAWSSVKAASWSPDGSLIAVVARIPSVESPPAWTTEFRVFSVAGEPQRTLPVEDGSAIIGWTKDAAQVIFLNSQGPPGGTSISLASLADGSVRTVANARNITALAVSPDGTRIAYAAGEGGQDTTSAWAVNVVSARDGAPPVTIAHLGGTPLGVAGLAWSPDGSEIAYGWISPLPEGTPRGIYVARADGQNTPRRITVTDRFDVDPRWSPDGRWLLADRLACVQCDGGGARTVVAAADGSHTEELPPGPDFTGSAAWAPAGARFVYGADALFVHDAAEASAPGGQMAWLPASTYASLTWTAGHIFFVRDGTNADVIYAAPPGADRADVLGVGYGIAVSAGGKTARFVNGTIEVIDARGTHTLAADFLHREGAPELLWSPDERQIALIWKYTDTEVAIVDLHDDGTWSSRAVDTRAGLNGVRWSPDSTSLAYVASDGAYVASAADGTPHAIFAGEAHTVDWSPDGATLAVAVTVTGSERVLVVAPAGEVRTTHSHDLHHVTAVRLSPDGDRLALASYAGLAVITVADRGVTDIEAHNVNGVAWSPDGARLAFGRDTCGTSICRELLTVASADGTDTHDVVEAPGRILTPLEWRSDGRIIFSSVRAGI
jgi:Tol biopolymer transport system component